MTWAWTWEMLELCSGLLISEPLEVLIRTTGCKLYSAVDKSLKKGQQSYF